MLLRTWQVRRLRLSRAHKAAQYTGMDLIQGWTKGPWVGLCVQVLIRVDLYRATQLKIALGE